MEKQNGSNKKDSVLLKQNIPFFLACLKMGLKIDFKIFNFEQNLILYKRLKLNDSELKKPTIDDFIFIRLQSNSYFLLEDLLKYLRIPLKNQKIKSKKRTIDLVKSTSEFQKFNNCFVKLKGLKNLIKITDFLFKTE